MEERPKLKLELSQADKLIEIIGWLLIFTFWALTIFNYKSLPERIPTHFNGAGVADGFGDKWMILTLPLLATAIFVGMTILNRFPHVFNYPTEVTTENALKQYSNATRLIRYLKVILVVIFELIAYQTIRYAVGQTEGLGTWFLPISMGLIFVPLVYFVIKSFKTNQ